MVLWRMLNNQTGVKMFTQQERILPLSLLVLVSFFLLLKFTYPTSASVGSEHGKTVVGSDENIAEEILISAYPWILKHRAGTLSRPVVTFIVKNNTGHPISKFSLKFRVRKSYPGISFVEITTSCDEVFDKSYAETDEEIVYLFSIKENAQLSEEQKADLVCVYEDKFGYAVELEPLIEPKPYDYADKNYDRVNDMLAARVAKILLMAPEERPEVPVLVMLNHPVTQADLDTFRRRGGSIKAVYTTVDGFAGDIPAETFDEYINAAQDALEFVDPDLPVEIYLDKATLNTRAKAIWNTPNPFGSRGLRGDPKTSVALIDTGIDDGHPAFGGRTGKPFFTSGYQEVTKIAWGNDPAGPSKEFEPEIDEIIVDYDGDGRYDGDDDLINDGRTSGIQAATFSFLPSEEGWDCLEPDKKIVGWHDFSNERMPEDERGHGSFCAGIVAGTGNPGGVYRGVAPDVKLVSATMGRARVRDLMAALEWVDRHKKDYHIIAVSQSSGVALGIPSWDETVNNAVSNGLILVQAAGNHFWKGVAIGSPGRARKILTVGAVEDHDKLAYYSSNGGSPSLVKPLKPDVVAPGGSVLVGGGRITSVYSNDVSRWDNIYNSYIKRSGTSYSAPHVAGEVALIVDAITDYGGIDSDRDGRIDEDPWNGINDDGDSWADDPAGTPNMYDPGIDEVFIDVDQNNRYDKGADKVLFAGQTNTINTPNQAPIFPLIDEDLAPWPYTEEEALRVKSIICMTSYEVHRGEVVPRGKRFRNAGASNAPRDFNNDGRVDKFDRGEKDKFGYYGKDQKEGYGRVCIDGAIEAVTKNWNAARDSFLTDEFGPNPWDKKVFVRRLHIGKVTERRAPRQYFFKLDVPPRADYDLYIYDGGNPLDMERPYREGDPKIIEKSTNKGLGKDEKVLLKASSLAETYYLVVKWVRGRGRFTLKVETPR